jgi:membrane protease YdiL (CAAX protease family)
MEPRFWIRTGFLAAATVASLLIGVAEAPPVPVAVGAAAAWAWLGWRYGRSRDRGE